MLALLTPPPTDREAYIESVPPRWAVWSSKKYFESKHAICASNAAVFANARMRAASASPRRFSRMRSSTIKLSAPVVNGPLAVFQNVAVASCSGVRLSEIDRTSASAVMYSAEPNDGGGGERS